MSQPTNFECWYDKNYANRPADDYGYGEQVWKAAIKHAWDHVFTVVTATDYGKEAELIALLETARHEDGTDRYGEESDDASTNA